MGRTKLFHTVVVVGSSLLSGCGKDRPAEQQQPAVVTPRDAARPIDSAPLADAAADAAADAGSPVDAGVPDAKRATKVKRPDPPRIHARPPPPPRIHVAKPPNPAQIMIQE